MRIVGSRNAVISDRSGSVTCLPAVRAGPGCHPVSAGHWQRWKSRHDQP